MTTFIWILVVLAIFVLLGALAAFARFKLAKIDMSFVEFARRLVIGGGFKNVSPEELDAMRRLRTRKLSIIDLRDRKTATKAPFPNAISSPFDSFLKDVVVDRKYHAEDPIVLVCDTGEMSRVAANILVEDEAFEEVYNLKGGVAKWKQWRASEQYKQTRIFKNWRSRTEAEVALG